MNQLQLTEAQFLEIGFSEKFYEADDMNPSSYTWEIPCTNGCFYRNQKSDNYSWYHMVIIGDGSNHTLLNIVSLPELYIILSAFNVKFEMVIK